MIYIDARRCCCCCFYLAGLVGGGAAVYGEGWASGWLAAAGQRAGEGDEAPDVERGSQTTVTI